MGVEHLHYPVTPLESDTLRTLEVKILNALNGAGGGGAGSGTGTFAGTGSPEGVVTASPGATYYDTASGFFYVKETGTGNTGWVALII